MKHKNSIYINQFIQISLSLAILLSLAGCGSKSMVVLLPDTNGDVGQVVVSTKGGEQILSKANQSVQAQGESESIGKVKVLTKEKINSTFSEALAAEPTPPELFILYFRHNSDELTDESTALTHELVQAIQKRVVTPDVVISGHTDTVGEMDYNYKLSLERAEVVYKILVAQGVAPANIIVTSHGEGNLLVKTGDNVEEPKNRRVEVVIK